MKTAAEVRNAATLAERNRLNLAIDTQISILWERIDQAKNDDIKSAWTVAIIELQEVKKLVNFPLAEKWQIWKCSDHNTGGSNYTGTCPKCAELQGQK